MFSLGYTWSPAGCDHPHRAHSAPWRPQIHPTAGPGLCQDPQLCHTPIQSALSPQPATPAANSYLTKIPLRAGQGMLPFLPTSKTSRCSLLEPWNEKWAQTLGCPTLWGWSCSGQVLERSLQAPAALGILAVMVIGELGFGDGTHHHPVWHRHRAESCGQLQGEMTLRENLSSLSRVCPQPKSSPLSRSLTKPGTSRAWPR